MASAEIITIGTELLLGQLVDTNTAQIARAFADVGIDVYRHATVGDNENRIAESIREGLRRADIIVCAGGLGPTVDDLTRDATAAATARPLVLHEPSMRAIRERFARFGRTMAENNRLQALAPEGSIIIENPYGSAPGFIVDDGSRVIIAMPGPPRELSPMLHDRVVPWLVERFSLRSLIVTRVLHTTGVAESDVDARIADLFRAGKNPSIAVLAHEATVDVKVTAKADSLAAAAALIDAVEPELRQRLGDCICAVDEGTLEASLGASLRNRGWSIATAESCTGGHIAAIITSVPGASDYFRGGVIAYADDAKRDLLGVDASLIDRHGAVSEEVAAAMARGVRVRFHSTIAVADTGIAGPCGDTADKPVGLVYVALARADGTIDARRLNFPGERYLVQRRAAVAALTMAWKEAR